MSLKTRAALRSSMMALLAERYPQCFVAYARKRRPLKIGIHLDLASQCPDIDPRKVGATLAAYTGNCWYLQNIKEGAIRVDLDGHPAGAVTPEEAEHARKRLLAMAEKEQKKRDAWSGVATSRPKPVPTSGGDSLAALREAGKRRREAAA